MTAPHQYACPSCGAALEFEAGTSGLNCPYCSSSLELPDTGTSLHKLDYVVYAAQPHPPVASLAPFELTCRNCAAHATTTAIALRCPSCRAAMIAGEDLGGQLKAPDAVLPFHIDQAASLVAFRAWTSSRWFAPSALKKVGNTESMRGSYLPHWTFDDRTTTDYTGQRGDYYYTTETYTTTQNGRSVTQTRQVRHTRWSGASGRVARDFVDVVAAAVTTPERDKLLELGPWSLQAATDFRPEYLAGFDSPRYQVDADAGFVDARQQMAQIIEGDCRQDIGGDEQRVQEMRTYDKDVLFRLVLLPLWLATYVSGGKQFHVYVNANTGEVIGERPYSWVKITAAVLAALLLIAVVFLLYQR